MKLLREFYDRDNVVLIAKELLGKRLCTNINGIFTCGLITETEAYEGITDRASHAYGGRRTARTEVMYGQPGIAYVYLCYGMHYLFNVVTNKVDIPHAVLIRGILPVMGEQEMMRRRGNVKSIGNGPGKLTKAMGITLDFNGEDLLGDNIWIEDHQEKIDNSEIFSGTRIGVDYAGEDALLPYRFYFRST